MNYQKNMDELVLDILNKYPNLYDEYYNEKDWYLKRKFFLEDNKILLNELVISLNDKDYDVHNLFNMQKLYLSYPNKLPDKLALIPWNNIDIILNLYSKKKKKFYIDLCLYIKPSSKELKKYICHDLYEKSLKVPSNIKKDELFYSKLIEVESLIYE